MEDAKKSISEIVSLIPEETEEIRENADTILEILPDKHSNVKIREKNRVKLCTTL